jgi:YrbI family 3-deoxy-D-manno-octulosonate 8-phosphate phosphatase
MKSSKSSIQPHDIDLVVYDFDGVMTDNRVLVFQDGAEAVMVNRADGLGVSMIRDLGIPQLILSTETNPVVKARADKLQLEVIAPCVDKKLTLIGYCEQKGYLLSRVMYVGNDLNDREAMKIAGFPIAPADGHPVIQSLAKLVTKAKGGDGVIREISDFLSAETFQG